MAAQNASIKVEAKEDMELDKVEAEADVKRPATRATKMVNPGKRKRGQEEDETDARDLSRSRHLTVKDEAYVEIITQKRDVTPTVGRAIVHLF